MSFDDVRRKFEHLRRAKGEEYQRAIAARDQAERAAQADLGEGHEARIAEAGAASERVNALGQQLQSVSARLASIQNLELYAECVERGSREEAIIAAVAAQRALDREVDYWLSVRELRAPPPPPPK